MKARWIMAVMATAFVMNSANATVKELKNNDNATVKVEMIGTTSSDNTTKWEYTYDKDGNVLNKVGYIRTSVQGDWMPRIAYSLHYDGDEVTVTSARWNSKTRTFTLHPMQQTYKRKDIPESVK